MSPTIMETAPALMGTQYSAGTYFETVIPMPVAKLAHTAAGVVLFQYRP